MIVFALGLLLSLIWSAFVAAWLGITPYVVVAGFAFFVVMGLFVTNERRYWRESGVDVRPMMKRYTIVHFVTHLMLAVWFACTWAFLPFVIWFGRISERGTARVASSVPSSSAPR